MEDAFQDLFRLLWEAKRGQQCACEITVRAYVQLAQKAARGLLAHALDEDEERKLRFACSYAERFTLRQKRWGDVIRFLGTYWEGVEDGFFERTQPSRTSKTYELGYRLGRYGR